MSFKFKRVDVIAGDTNFPVGDTDALRRTRSESVLKLVADTLISMNIGWQLDSTRLNDSSTTSDFADSPCRSGNITYPALFFKNSLSGCKLYLAYYGGLTNAANCVKDFSAPNATYHVDIFGYGDAHINGLCASIIAEGSSQTFGQTFDSSFLPNDATRIIGTCFYYTSPSSTMQSSHCYNPTSGYHYSWGIYATDKTIAICSNYSSNTIPNLGYPVYATGKIIGNLVHEEDNAINSKYGTIVFRLGDYTSEKEGSQTLMKYTVSSPPTSGIVPLRKMASSSVIYNYATASFSKADGSWINAITDNDYTNGVGYIADFFQITSSCYTPTANKTRWLPINISVLATDLATYGVVPGDGFKGWLDTDLFRCAVSSYGKYYDNGKFLCPENNFNMLIGWNPTNTDTIQGS
jgi:hypothetical protein